MEFHNFEFSYSNFQAKVIERNVDYTKLSTGSQSIIIPTNLLPCIKTGDLIKISMENEGNKLDNESVHQSY